MQIYPYRYNNTSTVLYHKIVWARASVCYLSKQAICC